MLTAAERSPIVGVLMRTVLLSFLVATVLLPSPAARAQQTSGEEEHEAETELEARRLFDEASQAYEEGRFEDALEGFRAVHALYPDATLLYNIGNAADRLRRDQEAIDAFEAFIEAMPDAAEVTRVRRRIEVLREQRAADESSHATESSVLEAGAGQSSPLPLVTTIVGAVFLVTGAVLLGVSLADKAAVESLTRADERTWTDTMAQFDRVPTLSAVGFVGIGLGAALLAAGLVWMWMDDDDENNDGDSLSVAVGLGVVQVGGSF